MRVAVMQPYFFPYIGYFQLINAADEFIVYDNIQYSKEGWINRNRILSKGAPAYFTVPLKRDSDYLDICEREVSPEWKNGRYKALNRIKESYRKAPFAESVFPLVESCFMCVEINLFKYIHNSLEKVTAFLGITTPVIVSSDVNADHTLRSADRVIDLCHSRKADSYLNPAGGMELYDRKYFAEKGIGLYFIKTTEVSYRQFDNEFIPSLSIIDVMMFNSPERIREFLNTAFVII